MPISRLGETVAGSVIRLEPAGALVDIGMPRPAYLPLEEMSKAPIETSFEVLELNETREFRIVAYDEKPGQNRFVLSMRSLEEEVVWERLRQVAAAEVTVRSIVLAMTEDGAFVQKYEGWQGFIPRQHISSRRPMRELVGKELPLQLIEINESRNLLIFSHRRALIGRRCHRIKVGDLKSGRVVGIKPYGVFINIGGLDGRLEFSEISHKSVENPHSVFKVNEQVKVLVIELDAERCRIGFSTKQLEPEAGDMLKNSQLVYERAEEMAAKYRQKLRKDLGEEYSADVIDNLTKAGLEYIDNNGNKHFIDFQVCAKDSRYVAQISVSGEPWWEISPYMEFFAKPLTRFFFNNKKDFRKLRWQIKQLGWLVIDLL